MMNRWAFNPICFITIFLLMTMTSGISFANSQIWSKSLGMGLGPAAASFNISSGSASITSTNTRINYYTTTDCSVLSSSVLTTGTFTFNSPSQVQANAASIWSINSTNTTSSIEVIPLNAGVFVFSSTPCFPVTCSTALASCIYTGGAVSVSLN